MLHQSDFTIVTHHDDLGLVIKEPYHGITKTSEQALSHTALHDQHDTPKGQGLFKTDQPFMIALAFLALKGTACTSAARVHAHY